MNKIKYLLVGIVFASLCSCLVTHGNTTTSSIAKTDTLLNDTLSKSFHTFYDGEQLNFNYKKIGFVEAKGKQYAKANEVLDELRHKAWKSGANGLILVKKEMINRETGYLLNDSSNRNYVSTTFSGIAVKIEYDSTFFKKNGKGDNLSFVTKRKKAKKAEARRFKNDIGASAFFGLIIGTLITIAVTTSN